MLLASYTAPAILEIRLTKAPENPYGWKFAWAVIEIREPRANGAPEPIVKDILELPDGSRVLDGTGLNGHPGSKTLAEAFTTAQKVFAALGGAIV